MKQNGLLDIYAQCNVYHWCVTIIKFPLIGYYRVNYDEETWSAIAKILHNSHSNVHVVNRAQVSGTKNLMLKY